jgi:hypothetical protein
MDALLYGQYRKGGGPMGPLQWEFSAGVDNWGTASSPGLTGKLLLQKILGHEAPDRWARSTQNIVHWSTGVGWCSLFATVAIVSKGAPWTWGLAFGSTVWLASYVVLPFTKIYQPIWKYDAKTLMEDLGAHLVYGVTSAAVLGGLARRTHYHAQ